jgi:uncharacterized protein
MNTQRLLRAAWLLFLSFLFLASARAADSAAGEPARLPGKGVVGAWLGALDVQGFKLRLGLNVAEADGKLAAVLDSIDQNAKLPVSSIEAGVTDVRFAVQAIGASYEGKFSSDGAEIDGTWTQGGASLPLVLKRLAKPFAVSRSQEPVKPYPYREEELTFPNATAGIHLAGTLTLPAGAGPHPAVILMSGSGPQDRDESVMGHKPFLVLADHLTRAGIAVLRYDDRGVGRSGGKFGAATHLDFASDGRAALAFLKTRPEIDPRRIGLLGHSEGTVHAPLAALEAGDVAFIVSLAGVGVPMRQLIERQAVDMAASLGLTYVISPEERAIDDAIYERLRSKPDDPETAAFLRAKMKEAAALLPADLKKAMGFSDEVFEARIRMVLTPWFKKLALYDPVAVWKQIHCPVLALNGDKDVQVAADENLEGLSAALAAGGNERVTVKKFPGLNHLFQRCKTGAVSEYGEIDETMSPEVLKTVAAWINAQASARTPPAK